MNRSESRPHASTFRQPRHTGPLSLRDATDVTHLVDHCLPPHPEPMSLPRTDGHDHRALMGPLPEHGTPLVVTSAHRE